MYLLLVENTMTSSCDAFVLVLESKILTQDNNLLLYILTFLKLADHVGGPCARRASRPKASGNQNCETPIFSGWAKGRKHLIPLLMRMMNMSTAHITVPRRLAVVDSKLVSCQMRMIIQCCIHVCLLIVVLTAV